MELLNPVELGMLKRRVKEKDIVFRLQLQPDLFIDIVEPIVLLIFQVCKADKLFHPVLNQGL